jgi:hypothetical protein
VPFLWVVIKDAFLKTGLNKSIKNYMNIPQENIPGQELSAAIPGTAT